MKVSYKKHSSLSTSKSTVKKGYKQTEVGIIPEDWEINFIENIANITTGGKNTQDRVDDGLYPFFVRSQIVECINSYSFDGEAVLTAGDGVGTGKVFHYINGKFDAHQRVYRISDFSECINGYFFYLYFSTCFYNRIMQMTAKSSVDSVRREMIAKMPIPLPPTKAEQETIAEALSDADALIESLEQLIAKKRLVKQGAMQKLLTGKKRLPGFQVKKGYKQTEVGLIPEDWTKYTIGDLIEFEGGSQPDKSVFNGSWKPDYIRLIQIRDYKTDKFETYIPTVLARRFCTERDIMIGRYGPPIFQILRGLKGAYNVALIKAIPNAIVDKAYAYYFLKRDVLFTFIEKLSQRSSGQTGVDLKELKAYLFPLPPTKAEQEAIAEILSDMDDEISTLEEKLDKARQIKQGMMQELLTGKTRLI